MGGFSPSTTYRRKDRETDPDRDRLLIEDGIVAIADAIAGAGTDWHRGLRQKLQTTDQPDKIECCLSNGEVLNRFDYPLGYETSRADCLAIVRHVLGSYWQLVDGKLQPKMKVRPLPDFVRVVDTKGAEICRWSATDLQANGSTIKTHDWLTAPQDGSVINVRFPDGKTVTEARWNTQAGQWETPRRGKWSRMREVHGVREPTVWWP
jgi:hypothetical protein